MNSKKRKKNTGFLPVNGQMPARQSLGAGGSNIKCPRSGFTLVEIIIYIALLSLIALLVSSVVIYFTNANNQSKGDREVLENARRALEEITYEVIAAKGLYTPTTGPNQLSLETLKYLPAGEITSYIDFFICNTDRICLKKDGQNPIFITGDTVQIDSLAFNQVSVNAITSIKINLTMSYKNIINGVQPSVSFTSTASFRDN